MQIKFFHKDIITGHACQVGDIFTALFFGSERAFIVVSTHTDCFFAEMA